MNRFLAGLVERAEGRAPVLQRRPRSLFEPEAQAGGASAEPFEREEVRGPMPPHREPRDDAPPPQLAVEAARRPQPEEPVAPAPGARGSRRAPLRGREEAPTPLLREEPRSARRAQVAKRADEAEEAPRRPTPRAAPVPTATPTLVGAQRPAPMRERATTKADSVAPPARARGPVDTPAPPKPPVPSAQRTPTPPVAPAMVSRARPVAQHPAVVLARSQTAVVARREQAAAPAPAPVQITIGRVEVRAAPGGPERAPRTAGPASPRLSLDDYLRQRNTGAR